MEHKLITGGEQFLPFARSRIKALRAAGLKYASQQFEIDGCSVKVRIEPGHEYISLSGGDTIRMDSGVVNITNLTMSEPREVYDFRGEPLAETDYLAEYNAPFITDPASGWRKNQNGSGQGQISGDLEFSGGAFHGKVPQNYVTARSFTPRTEGVLQPDGTTKWVPATDDDALWLKKLTAVLVPPSMFTGRCRLFVQALYGAPRYSNATDGYGTTLGDGAALPTYGMGPGGTPCISIAPYRRSGDTTDYPDVVVHTGTGITLDSATGKHWLIDINPSGHAAVIPLISSPAGEKLRAQLKAGAKTTLSFDEREHLEAYVLSQCRPDMAYVQTVALGRAVTNYAMGYSWHWNWDGMVADIVQNDSARSLGWDPLWGVNELLGMTSWHYRTTMSVAGEGSARVWTGATALIEGPVEWSVLRMIWNISEPEWGAWSADRSTIHAEKTTPKWSKPVNCNAPFYVFYTRNEIQVCRVRVVSVDAPEPTRIQSDGYAVGGFGTIVDQRVIGLAAGYAYDRIEDAKWTATFTVGGYRTIESRLGGATHDVRVMTSARTVTVDSVAPPILTGYTQAEFDGGSTYDVGYPSSPGVWTREFVPNSVYGVGSQPAINYTQTDDLLHTYNQSLLTAVVPLYDAEAIFMHGQDTKHRDYSGIRTRTMVTSGGVYTGFPIIPVYGQVLVTDPTPHYVTAIVGYDHGPAKVKYDITNTFGAGQLTPDAFAGDYSEMESVVEMKLISKAGASTVDMGDLMAYHNDYEFGNWAPGLLARAGCRTNAPVVIARPCMAPIGTSLDGDNATLVGWV